MQHGKMLFIAWVLFPLSICTGVQASTQSVAASMTFDTALGITKVSDISFGLVKASATSGIKSYTINTSGVVTSPNGGEVIGGNPTSGSLTITGSNTQTVEISTGGYVPNNGVTLTAATCAYDGSAARSCDSGLKSQAAPGEGKVLRLGVTAMSDGTAAIGSTASPTFVVTVVYG